MKLRKITRIASFVLAASMMLAVAGCGNQADNQSSSSGSSSTSSTSSTTPTGKKEKVVVWYLWSGAEGELIENASKEFSAQSDKYEIESLSVPDTQKIVIAISSGDGPDLVDDFSYNIGTYVGNGIMEPLDKYVADAGINLDEIYASGALQSCIYQDTLYALPINSNCNALFYNKDLLAEAGYTEPPKTLEEMLEMAIKMTKTNSDGTIDVLGFPCFPSYAINDILGLCGGGWYVDGKMNAEAPGNAQALQYYIDYRKEFGVDPVSAFTTAGKSNDPSDPFFQGKQAFRIDGNWFPTMIEKTFKSDVNYGVAPIPYPENHPELANTVCVSSSMFYIPISAKNKQGAFEALTYFTGPIGQDSIAFGMGNLPSAKDLLVSDNYSRMPGMDFFAEYSVNPNTFALEQYPQSLDYTTIVAEETELAYNLKQTAEEAIAKIVERSKGLF